MGSAPDIRRATAAARDPRRASDPRTTGVSVPMAITSATSAATASVLVDDSSKPSSPVVRERKYAPRVATPNSAPAAEAGSTRRSKRVASTSASATSSAAMAFSANDLLMVSPATDSGAMPR